MIKVFFFDHTAKWSGGEIALYRTLAALDRAAFSPVVIVSEDGPLVERLAELSIPTTVLPLAQDLREVRKDTLGSGGIVRRLGTAAAYARYAVTLAQLLRKEKAQVLHCNSLKADFIGAVAGRLARVPVIWHVRDHINDAYLPRPMVRLFRLLAKSVPSTVLTNSQSTEDELFPRSAGGAGRQRTKVVHDGLMASELLAPPPTSFTAWRSPIVRIGLLGRLVEWKGQHVFIEAARLLTERKIEARFQIIGSALFGEQDYEAQIRRAAEPLGERVEFLGFRSDVPSLLRNLDILVHCSITPEPFGQVVVEGMAEGLPVIASDGGGVREIITDGVDGLRTPMGDAKALADALERLIGAPELASRLGLAAHGRVRSNFTAERTARAIESIYRELCGVRVSE